MAKREASGQSFGDGWWGQSRTGSPIPKMRLQTSALEQEKDLLVNDSLQTPECSYCQKRSCSLKTCTRCKQARYCDRECQKNDYKSHKTICKSVQEAGTSFPTPQPKDSVERARLAQERMGGYEMDLFFNSEADLHQNAISCQKNPGHIKFIPVNRFSMDDLPDGWKQEAILKYLQERANKTVKLVCRWVSKDRPPDAHLYNERGTKSMRAGTGYIFKISKKRVSEREEPCPCKHCVTSGATRSQWYHVSVLTAKHIVHDISEAKYTVVHVGFDDDQNRHSVEKLTPYSVVDTSEFNEDMIILACAVHEKTPNLRKAKQVTPFSHLIKPPASGPALVAIVSHPHGCCKVISLGWLKSEKKVDSKPGYSKISYTYDTPTCPGTSGAPVWVVGSSSSHLFFSFPPHSCHVSGGTNQSGECLAYAQTQISNSNIAGSSSTSSSSSAPPAASHSSFPESVFPPAFSAALDANRSYNIALRNEIHCLRRVRELADTTDPTEETLAEFDIVWEEFDQANRNLKKEQKKSDVAVEGMRTAFQVQASGDGGQAFDAESFARHHMELSAESSYLHNEHSTLLTWLAEKGFALSEQGPP